MIGDNFGENLHLESDEEPDAGDDVIDIGDFGTIN